MRKFLILFLLSGALSINAQDVIVKKDGSETPSKVLEVNQSDVKYKKFSNLNGPIYSISISDIEFIKYENGELDSFDTSATSDDVKGYIDKPADSRNAEIIAKYNRIYEPSNKVKKSDKWADRCLIFLGIRESSIMSNEDVEMAFEAKTLKTPYYARYLCYGLKISNKSNHTIYVDKARCFRSSSEGDVFCYFNNGMVSEHIASLATNRLLVIPPQTSKFLVEEKWEGDKLIEGMERFRFKDVHPNDIGLRSGIVKYGQVKQFNDEELPWRRKYIITYSHDESLNTFSCLNAEFYIKEIFGCQSLMSKMNYRPTQGGLFEGEIKYDKFIDDINEYTIVGYHKFDYQPPAYHSTSYVVESLKRSDQENFQIANAIVGSAYSTINAFTQTRQGGFSVVNSSGSTNSISSDRNYQATGDSQYNNNSYGSSTSSSKSSPQHDLCNGTGKCNSCNGTGKIWKSFGLTGKTKCPNCNGSGICSGCKGTGHR